MCWCSLLGHKFLLPVGDVTIVPIWYSTVVARLRSGRAQFELRPPQTRKHVCGKHCFPKYFLGCANEQKAKKNVLLPHCANEETFAEEANFASASNVACARKRGKQCFCNTVSMTMFPRLRRPLGYHVLGAKWLILYFVVLFCFNKLNLISRQ